MKTMYSARLRLYSNKENAEILGNFKTLENCIWTTKLNATPHFSIHNFTF